MKKEINYDFVLEKCRRLLNKNRQEPLYFIIIQCLVKKKWFSQRTKFWTEEKITEEVNKHLENSGKDKISEIGELILWLEEEQWIEKVGVNNADGSKFKYRITDLGNEFLKFLNKISKPKKKHN